MHYRTRRPYISILAHPSNHNNAVWSVAFVVSSTCRKLFVLLSYMGTFFSNGNHYLCRLCAVFNWRSTYNHCILHVNVTISAQVSNCGERQERVRKKAHKIDVRAFLRLIQPFFLAKIQTNHSLFRTQQQKRSFPSILWKEKDRKLRMHR